MSPAGVVDVDTGGAAVGAGAEVADGGVVTEEFELSGGGVSRTWCWHGILQSVPLGHEDPEG